MPNDLSYSNKSLLKISSRSNYLLRSYAQLNIFLTQRKLVMTSSHTNLKQLSHHFWVDYMRISFSAKILQIFLKNLFKNVFKLIISEVSVQIALKFAQRGIFIWGIQKISDTGKFSGCAGFTQKIFRSGNGTAKIVPK